MAHQEVKDVEMESDITAPMSRVVRMHNGQVLPKYRMNEQGTIVCVSTGRIARVRVKFCDGPPLLVDDLAARLPPSHGEEWTLIADHDDYEMQRTTKEIRHRHTHTYAQATVSLCGASSNPRQAHEFSVSHLYETTFPEKPRLFESLVAEMADLRSDLDFSGVFAVTPEQRRSLWFIRDCDLVHEYADPMVDVGGLFAGAQTRKYQLMCRFCDGFYLSSPQQKTDGPPGCSSCRQLTPEERRNVNMAADDWEMKVVADLKARGDIAACERTGHMSNPVDDAVVTLSSDNIKRLIQIKVLSKSKGAMDSWRLNHRKGDNAYPDNMPLFAGNYAASRFVVGMARDLSRSSYAFGYAHKGRRPNPASAFQLTDYQQALDSLVKLLPSALIESELPDEERYSRNHLLEQNSLHRLERACVAHGKAFTRSNTNTDVVDGRIGARTFQHKYTSQIDASGMRVANMSKKVDGRRQAYADLDVELFVFEVHDHHDQFLIIPAEVLVASGNLASSQSRGKTTIPLPPPDAAHEWQKYWNSFDLL